MSQGIFTKMSPRQFNFYALSWRVPWRWERDSVHPGFLEEGEVECLPSMDCSRSFNAEGKLTPFFWREAGRIATSGLPNASLQIVLDRWRDGDPSNNVPLDDCRDRSARKVAETGISERQLCGMLMRRMHDTSRQHPGKRHGGDLQGLADSHPFILRMGFNAVWPSPFWKNAVGFAPGSGPWAQRHGITGYHGYWGSDFASVDPHLGGEEIYHRVMELFFESGIAVQADLIMNHAGPMELLDLRKLAAWNPSLPPVMGTLDAGAIRFNHELASDYWREHQLLGLRVGEFVRNPFDPPHVGTFFHHTQNITYWTFEPAESCTYWRRMESGTLAGLASLNVYGNPAARNLVARTVERWSEHTSGARIDTLIYVVNPPGCNAYPGRPGNIVFEMVRRIRGRKEGHVPIVGEWFDALHPHDSFEAGVKFYLTPAGSPEEQLDIFDFGFHYAVHESFGSIREPTLRAIHRYLAIYAKLPLSLRARLSPFVDNHDRPVLLNEKGWPTFDQLHQAHILSYLFQGTPSVYAQDLRYLHDTGWNLGLFGRGGDPFNRIFVNPPVPPRPAPFSCSHAAPKGIPSGREGIPPSPGGGEPLLTTPMARLVQRLNGLPKRARYLGSFETGLAGKGRFNFGDDNVLAIRRSYLGEELLYLHLRKTRGDLVDPEVLLQSVRVDFPPGRYRDPITAIQYEVTAERKIRPMPGNYFDPVWKRWTWIDGRGRLHLADGPWTNDATGTRYEISNDSSPIPPGTLKARSPDSDIPGRVRLANSCHKWYPIDGRYRLVVGPHLEEVLDIKGGRVSLLPSHRTVLLTRMPPPGEDSPIPDRYLLAGMKAADGLLPAPGDTEGEEGEAPARRDPARRSTFICGGGSS